MRGRKPKPTVEKVLAGNPGGRPLNEHEAQPEVRMPRCPEHLGDEARKEWKRMARQLFDAGLLTSIDRAALAAYCVCYGRWAEAETLVKEKGTIVKTTNGNIVQNPYLAIANRAMDDMRKYLIEFGMTPSSRSRVKAVDMDGGDDLASLLFFDDRVAVTNG